MGRLMTALQFLHPARKMRGMKRNLQFDAKKQQPSGAKTLKSPK